MKSNRVLLFKAGLYRYLFLVEIDLKMFMRSHKHLFATKYTNLFMRKKKSNLEFEPKEKKSRAKFQCPPELKLIIDLAASIPPNRVLPDWREVLAKHKQNNFPANYADWQPAQKRALKFSVLLNTYEECIQGLPEQLKSVLLFQSESNLITKLDIPLEEDDKEMKEAIRYLALINAFHLYEKFRQVRAELRGLVDFLTKYRKEESLLSVSEELSDPEELPKFEIKYTYDEHTESIKSQSFDLYGAIYKKNLNRLRACEICRLIFWANNKNSFTCSKSCLNALRQRRHREKNKEEINAKRRSNYQQKKKIEKIRRNKNGTL
ncbi:MAG TPA: hypothetical protein VNI60_08880 [Pyrinomonadaceae bacterium]|nr:hypothetical protein [Pyrinomonadaceae bacterium]